MWREIEQCRTGKTTRGSILLKGKIAIIRRNCRPGERVGEGDGLVEKRSLKLRLNRVEGRWADRSLIHFQICRIVLSGR